MAIIHAKRTVPKVCGHLSIMSELNLISRAASQLGLQMNERGKKKHSMILLQNFPSNISDLSVK